MARSTGAEAVTPGAQRVRPQLDPSSILDAAARLAAESPDSLTVRRLGRELGADPTAIYRHFRDKDELVRGVIDRLIAACVARVDPHADWRTRLTQLADTTLEAATAHPTVGAVMGTQTTGGAGETSAVELIIRAMTDAGLGEDDSVRYYAVYSSYVLAFSSSAASNRLMVPSGDDDDDPRWLGGSAGLLSGRYPALRAVRPQLESLRDGDVFDFGVQVILDAIEARGEVSGRAKRPRSGRR
jgi:AcrR family transcriptional regulator